MAMVQNQLHNSLVEKLETTALTTSTSTIHSADNGSDGDIAISNANQMGAGPKIMNAAQSDLIKIIPYEANITKVFMVAFWHADI